jgi:hypothetical protein
MGHDASDQAALDTLLVQSHYNLTFNSCGRIPGTVPGTSSPPF